MKKEKGMIDFVSIHYFTINRLRRFRIVNWIERNCYSIVIYSLFIKKETWKINDDSGWKMLLTFILSIMSFCWLSTGYICLFIPSFSLSLSLLKSWLFVPHTNQRDVKCIGVNVNIFIEISCTIWSHIHRAFVNLTHNLFFTIEFHDACYVFSSIIL